MIPLINILHLEDSVLDSELIRSKIECGGIPHTYFLADTEDEYLRLLKTEPIDIILSDYFLPDYNGSAALKVAREKYPSIPFVFISGTMGEDSAIESMLNGATDYVLKNKLERLVPAINRALHERELEEKHIEAEIALLESENLLREAQKLAHLGVWTWQADIDSVKWNQELYHIAGLDLNLPAPTYAEQSAIYTLPSWQLLNNAVENAIKTGKPYKLDLKLIHTDGTIRNVIAHGGIKVDDKEQVTGLFGTVQDITDRKMAEQELIRAKEQAEESDNLKTAFLQNISHEIRTPLNSIIGFSSLLTEEDITREEIKTYTAIINHSGIRLIDIVTSVLDISRIQTGQVTVGHKTFAIGPVIARLLDHFTPLAAEKNIALSFHKPKKELKTLCTDEAKLYQVLSNILHNALKFTAAGRIDFGYKILKTEIQFFVRDTGIGIRSEQFELIFGRFMQTELTPSKTYEGAGLGLAICKGLVELLGGRIWVESEIGKGATFFFTLPV
jgi:PAS domain S-box-containing protein